MYYLVPRKQVSGMFLGSYLSTLVFSFDMEQDPVPELAAEFAI